MKVLSNTSRNDKTMENAIYKEYNSVLADRPEFIEINGVSFKESRMCYDDDVKSYNVQLILIELIVPYIREEQ